jgi:beta-fructofuranosidase
MVMAALMTCTCCIVVSCSEDTYDPDPAKNWAGTSGRFESTDAKAFGTYYSPAIGRCGDVMPFWDPKAQEFKVLYLKEDSKNGAFYHPFWGISTKDCANYSSLNEVLPTGTSDKQQDAILGTGCAMYNEGDGLYYIYYTGENDKLVNRQVVLRATSPDFKTWTKDPSWTLRGDDYGYSRNDFRDPQIFKAEDGLWHMVITSRTDKPRFAEFKSSNMRDWEHVGSFMMVWNDRMCECPDIFQMGEYWYIVFSEQPVYSRQVKYFMAKSWNELKSCFSPPKWVDNNEDMSKLDSRAFYGAKTASNGTDRYIWGWCPIREGTTNEERNIAVDPNKEPVWGGSIVCHKIIQHSDGKLSLGEVPGIKAKYSREQSVNIMANNGFADGKLTGADAYVLYSRLGSNNHISFTATVPSKNDGFGISVVRGTDSEKYYTIRIEEKDGGNNHWIRFYENGSKGKGLVEGIDSYVFPTPADNTYKVDIYTDNSVIVVYINDNVCYTQRIYGIQKNCWSINGYGADVSISNVAVSHQ